MDKLDFNLSLEQQRESLQKEIEYLKKRLEILNEKEQLVNSKLEKKKGLESVQNMIEIIKKSFNSNLQNWKETLDSFETNQKILEKCVQVFQNLMENITTAVQSENTTIKNQMINKIAKFKADLDRNFISIIPDEFTKKLVTEMLEKVLILCSSLNEDAPSQPQTPVPSLPKITITLKDLGNFTNHLGIKAVENLNNNKVITLQKKSPRNSKRKSVMVENFDLSTSDNNVVHPNMVSQDKENLKEVIEDEEEDEEDIHSSLKKISDLIPKKISFGEEDDEIDDQKIISSNTQKNSPVTPIPELQIQNYICKWDIKQNLNIDHLISMKQGDVFSVIDKTSDWYFGTNLRTGDSGYVHSSNLVEDQD